VTQTLTLPFKLEDIGSNFGGAFDGGWKNSRGLPSLKIWERSNEKWGEIRGPILGFQIADNSYAILIKEYARR